MLKQLFHIQSEDTLDKTQQVLAICIGDRHAGFAVTDKDASQLYHLALYSFDEQCEQPLSSIFASHPELEHSFYKVIVGYQHPQSALVPLSSFNTSETGTMLKALYGINGSSSVISEMISGWQMHNVYAVPKEIHEWIARKFITGRYWHQYTISLKNTEGLTEGSHLLIDFRTDEFTVLALADNKLLLAQTFAYSTPEDVLFYLLKVCQEFNLSQQEVKLSLSGLIDKQSALYKDLYQYFIHISFRDGEWKEPRSEYPSHFFTSLNDLARCAS